MNLGEELKFLLGAACGMLAILTRVPEFELTEDDAAKLGESLDEVLSFYVPTKLDPRRSAMLKLALRAGGIVGIHMLAYSIRKRREAWRPAQHRPASAPAPAPAPPRPEAGQVNGVDPTAAVDIAGWQARNFTGSHDEDAT